MQPMLLGLLASVTAAGVLLLLLSLPLTLMQVLLCPRRCSADPRGKPEEMRDDHYCLP